MYVYCVLYLIYVLAAVVNMIAPGNQKRKSLFAGLSISESIITSMKAGILAIDFCTTIIIILSLVVLIPIIWDMLEGSKYQFRYPALVVLISFGIFSSMYAPLYYSFGLLAAPRRAVNIIIEAYYILIVVNLIYILGWLKKNVIQVKEKIELNKLVYYGFSAVVILLGTMALGNKEQLNSYVGFQTLISGEGQTYHQEVMERIEVLNNPDISEVELKPFTCKPKLLFMSDITEDITDYKNQACALYYGKEAVKLEEE